VTVGIVIAGLLIGLAAAPAAAANTLKCAPMWPQFCANVHVACVGKTRIPTRTFTLRFGEGGAEVSFDGGPRWTARVAETETGRVLRPAAGRDWIRIDPKGNFSHSIDRRGATVMSAGRCREVRAGLAAEADRGRGDMPAESDGKS
jgi:hypothetical protein